MTVATELSFGKGRIGEHYRFDSEQEVHFGEQLRVHTLALTQENTADCGDERKTIRFDAGEMSPSAIKSRVVPQLFGGLGLATTKALVAADAAFVRDATDIWDAYMRVAAHLPDLEQEDAGHFDCGASKSVRSSVEKALDIKILTPSISALMPITSRDVTFLDAITKHKQKLYGKHFYDTWDPHKHIEHLRNTFPYNLAMLDEGVAGDPLHGHNARAVYIIREGDKGFAKNAFLEDTGNQAFALTYSKMQEMATQFSGSSGESRAVLLAFIDDALCVAAGLVAPNVPVFM